MLNGEAEDGTVLRKKNRRKIKYCYYKEICRWKRDNSSNEVEIKWGIVWINILKRRFKKDLMNLIEANHQINMTSDLSITQAIISFKQ